MPREANASPPALEARARVHLVAPSSPFERERFERGLALIQARYGAQFDESLFAREGFLAGDDEVRLRQLVAALDDSEARAIIAVRGGYGATRLLPELDAAHVRQANKWLVGFSDVTALHALWARAGLRSIHGPMVASLPEATPETQALWFSLLEGQAAPPVEALTCLVPGRSRGRLFGGNLAVLAALVGTPYLPDLDGCVLLLEDVGERPYRVDRMLTTLLQAGVLGRLRGIVLGQFSQCAPGPDGRDVLHVLEERLAPLALPLVANAPVGHVADNRPLVLGAEVELDAGLGTLHFP